MWHAYWSLSSSLPNIKAIHWRIKVTYNFEKRLTEQQTWDDARRSPARPDIAISRDGLKKQKQKKKKKTKKTKKKKKRPKQTTNIVWNSLASKELTAGVKGNNYTLKREYSKL